MTDRLSEELVRRLRERAHDPGRRSGDAALAASSTSVEDSLRGVRDEYASQSADFQREVAAYLGGVNSPFAGMVQNAVTGDGSQARGLLGALSRLTGGRQTFAMTGAGVVSFGGPVDAVPAPPPASEQAVETAERELGFVLPPALRQVYLRGRRRWHRSGWWCLQPVRAGRQAPRAGGRRRRPAGSALAGRAATRPGRRLGPGVPGPQHRPARLLGPRGAGRRRRAPARPAHLGRVLRAGGRQPGCLAHRLDRQLNRVTGDAIPG